MNIIQLFRKYFFLTVGILFAFLFLANFMLNLLLKAQSDRPTPLRSPLFFARLVDDLGPDRAKNLAHMEELSNGSLPFSFLLVDEHGKSVFGETDLLPHDWEDLQVPAKAYEFRNLNHPYEPHPFAPFFPFMGEGGDHHPRHPHGFGPPPPGFDFPHTDRHPPFPPELSGGANGPPVEIPHEDQMIRLPGEHAQYLIIHFNPDKTKRKNQTQFFALSFALLIFSILIGVAVAMIFIFRSVGKKVEMADSVIAQLQKGNLKARFPIKKGDEFGAAMERFNKMADEIELLVERLVNTEQSRMKLLQELAHDLRTPVASLKNLLETLQSKENSLAPKVRSELISLSAKEADYFGRLIEDLLILAQVSEPRYNPKRESVDLAGIFQDEAESCAAQFNAGGHPIQIRKLLPVETLFSKGDVLLLRRMFRNVLQNACSYAKETVDLKLKVSEDGTSAMFIVEDDGPGISDEAIKAYGVRRMTRVMGSDHNGRLSVGLGSVIVKTVAELHRGTVEVGNHIEDGKIEGARVVLTLDLLS